MYGNLNPPRRNHGYAVIEFEWDPAKASANLRKHRVAFREAVTVLADGLSITVYDPDRSQ
jgi:uncharacterized DUF497 family protein